MKKRRNYEDWKKHLVLAQIKQNLIKKYTNTKKNKLKSRKTLLARSKYLN